MLSSEKRPHLAILGTTYCMFFMILIGSSELSKLFWVYIFTSQFSKRSSSAFSHVSENVKLMFCFDIKPHSSEYNSVCCL